MLLSPVLQHIERSRLARQKILATCTRAKRPAALQMGKYNDVGTSKCQEKAHRVQRL